MISGKHKGGKRVRMPEGKMTHFPKISLQTKRKDLRRGSKALLMGVPAPLSTEKGFWMKGKR